MIVSVFLRGVLCAKDNQWCVLNRCVIYVLNFTKDLDIIASSPSFVLLLKALSPM